ncbi:RHS repeat-associated core domain-containing protein [Kocuria carniphila]|uniref:RHS repeat-associated core domain-containing protein n=1 Tax=Kocuria carniphila TaxID=262208 RepID=A0ABV3UZV7_9MICC
MEEGAPSAGAPPRVLTGSTWDYDERGRVTAHVSWAFDDDPSSAQPVTTRYRYDGGDRVTGMELPHGRILTFQHDALGRLASAADGVGTEYDAVYNPLGDLQSMTVTKDSPGAQRQITWTYEYNARGLPSAVVGPDGRTELEYDAAGRVTRRREPGNVVLDFAWDAWGQLRDSVVDPGGLGLHTHWDYGPDGLLAQLTDPEGARTSWTYDALGRVRETLLPGGAAWHTAYDPAGAWIENVSPAGHRVRHHLDAAGCAVRRETVAAAGARTVPAQEFSYDPLGRLIQASQSGDTVQRRYDSLHRLIEETSDRGSIHLTYDDTVGTSVLRYLDGRSERTTYDLAGRSTHVQLLTAGSLGGTPGEVLASMSHMRLPTRLALPNGVVSEFHYDDLDRLVSVRHLRNGMVFERWDGRYDPRGHRALTRILTEPKSSSLHTFDTKDRVVEVRSGFDPGIMADVWTPQDHMTALAAATTASATATERESYVLNKADARVSVTRSRAGAPPVTELLTLGPDHRLLSVNGQPLTYHGDGQRSRDNRWVYDVDALSRVVEIRDNTSGAVRATFAYDALSRVIGGVDSEGSFTRTWWDGQPLEERRGAPGTLRQFTPHPLRGLPLCITDQQGRHFLHVDGGRSSMCVTNTSGAVVERHRYGTFGEPLILSGDGHAPLAAPSVAARWRGMSLNHALDLYDSPSRLYDPGQGVFLTPDPLLYTDSPSTTVFAGHDPVDFADPSGLAKSPLGDDAAPAPPAAQAGSALDWTTQTEWTFPPPARGLLQPITSADTGNRAVNAVANKVLLPWVNLLAFWTNVPLATLMGVDDAIKHSPFAVEYDAFQHVSPLFPAMGLALEGVPAAMGALNVLGRGGARGAVGQGAR